MREVGIILIASFAIDRIVTGLFFLLSYDRELRNLLDPDSVEDAAEKLKATRNYRLIYSICAGYLGTVIIAGHMGFRLSTIAGLSPYKTAGNWGNFLDILLTGLLLVGGADRLAEALKIVGGEGGKKAQSPIEITGKVVLEQSGRSEPRP